MELSSTGGVEVVNGEDRTLVDKAWETDVCGRLVGGKLVPPVEIDPLEPPAESMCVIVEVWPSRPVIVNILVTGGFGRYSGTTCVSICDSTTSSKTTAARVRSMERAIMEKTNTKDIQGREMGNT